MRIIAQIVLIAFVIFVILTVILLFYGKISFGHGLGDLYYLVFFVLWSIVIISIYIYILKKNNFTLLPLLYGFIITIIIITIVKLTIFRGPEFHWNGNILRRPIFGHII